MSTDVIMPQMGESIFEGTITKWLKRPGDAVQKDEPLFEISTDKVDAEIPSPADGVLSEIKFAEGETVQVNTVVAVLTEGGTAASPAPVKSSVPMAKANAANAVPTPAAPTTRSSPVRHGDETDVVMPQMGESIFEGTITKWLKKPGDTVERDEPLFEISTDKVDAEIPSPVAGIVTAIKAAEGTTVQVNTVVATIGSGASTAVQPVATAPVTEEKLRAVAAVSVATTSVAEHSENDKIRSSPLVRRIAREHNVDLRQIAGTGSGGRINKEDILRHLSRPVDSATETPSVKVPAPAMKDEVVAMSKMRAIIAQRLSESKRTIPHAHSVYKVDMTRIARLRERERAGFEQRHGVKLTYMPFIAAATIDALRRFPILNASLVGNDIHYHANIGLGIAVALEWGLIVPVIRQAEQADFVALARAIADLGGRARNKKLKPEEVGGSTFTLTNAGLFGGEFGTPVINPPESAILAIGGLRKEPAVLTDAEGNDTIAIRSVQYFCLGFDHRLIDGADAGRFMTEFKNTLENWNQPIG